MLTMAWSVELKQSVLDDLRWFGKRDGRQVLKEAIKRLAAEPLLETRQVKTLRPNSVAERELDSSASIVCYSTLTNKRESSRSCLSARSEATG